MWLFRTVNKPDPVVLRKLDEIMELLTPKKTPKQEKRPRKRRRQYTKTPKIIYDLIRKLPLGGEIDVTDVVRQANIPFKRLKQRVNTWKWDGTKQIASVELLRLT